MDSIKEVYKKFYTDIQFDRSLLFKTISAKYACSSVIYPGSSIHVTPSFYFPHVVYIDKSTMARDFFSRESEVKELILSNKHYPRTPYFQFLCEDFTCPLQLRENEYDLLIFFYSGEIPVSCKKHLKTGGILLTNNFSNGLERILNDRDFSLEAVLIYKKKGYLIIEDNLEQYCSAKGKTVKAKKNHSAAGFEFIKNEYSYIFRKKKPYLAKP